MKRFIRKMNDNARKPRKFSKQAGVSLPMVLLGIAMSGVVLAAAYSEYQSWQRTADVGKLVDVVRKVASTQESYRRQWGSFAGFTNAEAYRSDKWVPSDIKNSVQDKFLTPYSDDGIAFAEADSVTTRDGRTFNSASATPQWLETTFKALNTEACMLFVDEILGEALQVTVGATRIQTSADKTTNCTVTGTSGVDVAVIM